MIVRTFSVALPEGEIPREFRIFAAGVNTSTKGPVLFDEQAAESVMTEWQRQGVDLMLDLEHLSLDPELRNYDPDARGWGKLALRNGELWAVGVKWTPDGERRLTERRQRYVSPAFVTDKDGRVLSIVNVAITALPATHHAPPLIAASAIAQRSIHMNAETVQQALDAIESGDAAAAAEILKHLIAEAASGEAAADEAPAAEEAFAESEDTEEQDEEMMTELNETEEETPETETRAAKPVDVELAKTVQRLSAEFESVKAELEAERRSRLLASRPDIKPELRKTLSKQPLKVVQEILAGIAPPKVPPLAAAASAVATRGATQGDEQRASRLPPDVKAQMDIRMGLVETKKVNVQEAGVMKFGVTVPKGTV